MRLLPLAAVSLGLLVLASCNAITGADDFAIGNDDDDDEDGQVNQHGPGGASATSTGTGNTGTGAGEVGTSTGTGATATCGDGTCAGETCESCAADCGPCGPACGDGTCDASESCDACASDCGACSQCQGAGDATTALDADELAFLQTINDYRAQNGLGALAACTSLNRAAQGHSEDMRDNNYFDHIGLDGSEPWDRACDACYEKGCGPSTAMGENIAAGQPDAASVFDAWKNSPGHNANMLGGSFTQIGIGKATGGGEYGVYWTNVFGGDTEPSCN